MPNLPILHLPNKVGVRHAQREPERLRGRTLHTRNARILRRDPLCKMCLAKSPPQVSQSTIVDHIIPLHLGGSESDDNLQGLDFACHQIKTAQEATQRALKGYNLR